MITSNEITTEMRVAAYYVGARGDDIDAVLKMPYRHTYKKGDEWMDVYSRIGKAIIELRKRVIFLPCDLSEDMEWGITIHTTFPRDEKHPENPMYWHYSVGDIYNFGRTAIDCVGLEMLMGVLEMLLLMSTACEGYCEEMHDIMLGNPVLSSALPDQIDWESRDQSPVDFFTDEMLEHISPLDGEYYKRKGVEV